MSALRRSDYSGAATVYNVDDVDEQWQQAAEAVAGEVADGALNTIKCILDIVRSRGCSTIVVEQRYIDRDYQSEYSAFWAGRFESRPAEARRLHFFQASFDAMALPQLPTNPGYLGYCVVRPTALGAVGRTVIEPAQTVLDARLTKIVDRPSLFGHPLEVVGVPFCQQDGELLRCAHAAAWICHYVAFHRRVVARRLTADIASMPAVDASKYRPLPSNGLTAEQLQSIFSAMGIPAFFYAADDLPLLPGRRLKDPAVPAAEHNRRVRDERVLRVVCKYLNSGFPVVVLTESGNENHAFTLVGWRLDEEGTTQLVACDDRVGPYELIDSPELDGRRRGRWKGFMIPLPDNVYLTGEAAETRARQLVLAEVDKAAVEEDSPTADLAEIAPHLDALGGPISVRTRLMEGRRYKATIVRQGRHHEAVRIARMAHLPQWVWVVEFQDRARREAGDPCVSAEIVFDSTSHDERPAFALLSTRSTMIDFNRSTDSSDQSGYGPGVGALDGRSWRSIVSDGAVSDREYGLGGQRLDHAEAAVAEGDFVVD